jgi:hypothetical protein
MHGLREETSDRLETKNAYCQSPDYWRDAQARSPLHVGVAIFKNKHPRLAGF